MKRHLLFISLLLMCLGLSAQEPTQTEETEKIYAWPTDWLGTWQGSMKVRSVSSDKVQLYPMKLEVAETDTAGKWAWTLTYGEGEKADVRPYILIAQDSTHSHFIIDEKNSILLDQYLVGNHFISRFEVNGNLLIMDVRHEGDYLGSQITHGSMKDPRKSGDGLDDIEVSSYAIRGIQEAVLYRK
jgi:hypothetical protein